MRKSLLVVVTLMILLQSCNYFTGPMFKFTGSSYYRANTVTLNYDAQDIVQIDFYWTYGIDDPKLWNYMPGQEPAYEKAGTDTELTGTFVFNTAFTGVNWITLKGVAFKTNGEVIIDKIWFHVDNLGPDIDIEPRDGSYLKTLDKVIVRVADGGYDAGLDISRTSIVLKNSQGNMLGLSTPVFDGIGSYETRPVRSCSVDTCEISVIAYDKIGNPNQKTSIVHVVSTTEVSPEISIIVPEWNGQQVKGTIEFSYTSNQPLQRLVVDSSCFENPDIFGSFPSFEVINPSQNGTVSIDTTFTGSNPALFRLFGISEKGLSSTSNAIKCRIYNF